ncbi:enoyl-CoA hydratase [Pullulanibacillus pueri]|uniref:Enoyl-CoA hydratase n=1 Tax=Pullulanibacillus pueri TaxID=1437324 RepID=A0A8J2ZXE8_9BACL|nr:enoyl-CoA hydratase [Pullulanibacillus pueri]MBM7682004.1 enoyl-CoA hydratase [Pullulanibacillus pueri]GGH83724.1 enoyl-CoA hydratase [Pullulanibacillus pueri]
MTLVKCTYEDRVAVLTLHHPPANALSSAMINELDKQLHDIEEASSVKVVVIHGEGRFFSAGADIKEFTQYTDSENFKGLSRRGQDVFNRIENFSKPVIAAMHGAALGGGLELAMACHLRVADKATKFGLPELNLGLIPGFAGTQRLPRLVGVPKATEMMLTSEPIHAEAALKWGLVNYLVAEGEHLHEAMALAHKIAEKSAVSMAHLLACLSDAREGEYSRGMEREAMSFGEVFVSYDAKEGIKAFIEKRKPIFKDK